MSSFEAVFDDQKNTKYPCWTPRNEGRGYLVFNDPTHVFSSSLRPGPVTVPAADRALTVVPSPTQAS